jgi:hypothetical protein
MPGIVVSGAEEVTRPAWTFRVAFEIRHDPPADVAAVALRVVSAWLDEGGGALRGDVRDGGGEKVGAWEFEPYAPPVVDPLRDPYGEPDPGNYFAVGTTGSTGRVHIMNPSRGPLTRTDALRLVAWVAVLADLTDAEIAAARRQVERT